MGICIYKPKAICGPTTYKKSKVFAKSTTNPARVSRVGMIGGSIAPPRPIDPGPTPYQSTRGQPTRPNRCKTPPIAPRQWGQPAKPRPIKPGPINWGQSPGANNPRQTNPKQSPKQSPNRWGPIAPQTGQTTSPGQSPAKPKQPRKREFEVSAN